MSVHELLAVLRERGVTLTADGEKLKARPAAAIDEGVLELLKQHKAALLALLNPQRDADQEDCPPHWRHIPMLPPKGSSISALDELKGRYRVKLFGRWYLIRCEATVEAVAVVDSEGKRRMFADLHELYRWAWAEHYGPMLRYREIN